MGALAALGQLAMLGAEYAQANEERRAAILAESEQAYRAYKTSLAGLPAVLADSDRIADAAAAALPAPAPVAAPPAPAPAGPQLVTPPTGVP